MVKRTVEESRQEPFEESKELQEGFRKGVAILPTQGSTGDPSKVGTLPPPDDGTATSNQGGETKA